VSKFPAECLVLRSVNSISDQDLIERHCWPESKRPARIDLSGRIRHELAVELLMVSEAVGHVSDSAKREDLRGKRVEPSAARFEKEMVSSPRQERRCRY